MLTIELNMYHAVALGAFLFWLGGAGILTVKPTVVKNMIIKTVCSVASKLMDAMPME